VANRRQIVGAAATHQVALTEFCAKRHRDAQKVGQLWINGLGTLTRTRLDRLAIANTL
jgi:hypothetical protein